MAEVVCPLYGPEQVFIGDPVDNPLCLLVVLVVFEDIGAVVDYLVFWRVGWEELGKVGGGRNGGEDEEEDGK